MADTTGTDAAWAAGTAAAELDAITNDLVGKLHDKRSRRAELYGLMHRVESAQLWRAGGFNSMTKWMEDLARRAGCQIQYLWRVKKAGKFYTAYEAAEHAAGRTVATVGEVQLGDEMLADIDRIAEGKPERAREYIEAALAGELTKAKVKEMVKTAAGARRAAKAKAKDKERGGAPVAGASDVAPCGVTAVDIVLALDNAAIFYSEEERTAHLLKGARRRFAVMTEFPVQTGTADRARRIDALVVGNRGGVDQYECTLDMVEIKVTESDLRADTKHLEYEPFADRCWFAVPAALEDVACEVAPDGWGVIVYDPAMNMTVVERMAAMRPGVMRAATLATALLRSLPTMREA